MTSFTGREGLLSRRLATGSNRMERLLGLSSHYSFASSGESPEELREEDVWLAGGLDEDVGDEKKNTVYFHLHKDFANEKKKTNYFPLQEDFGDEEKMKNNFHLQEDFGDEKKKMKNCFPLQEDFCDETKKMMNYFHMQEDLVGDKKKKVDNFFHLQANFGDNSRKTKNYFHFQEGLNDETKKMKNYFHLQEDLGHEKEMKNYFHLRKDLSDEKSKMMNYFHSQDDFGDEKKTMKKYFNSGKNSGNIVKLSDGLGISGLSEAFDDLAAGSREVSFVSSSRVIPRVETLIAEAKCIIYQSAPVKVPDWTKILGIHHHNGVDSNAFTVDDDDVDDDERLPPHEYLAREHARSHVDATSVQEGFGRKLKGRDLSRVRNAVWKRTGFLG